MTTGQVSERVLWVSLKALYSSSCYSYREDKREDLGTFKSNTLSVTGEHWIDK